MSLGRELKRRLEIGDEPLTKRLKLAENVLNSDFFPEKNRHEIVLQWICDNLHQTKDQQSRISLLRTLKKCLKRLLNFSNFSSSSVLKFVTVLATLVSESEISVAKPKLDENIEVTECCISLIENSTILPHFQQSHTEYFSFLVTVLKNVQLRTSQKENQRSMFVYNMAVEKTLSNLSHSVKNFPKKTLLVDRFISSKLLNVILEFMINPKLTNTVLHLCQYVLFPQLSLKVYKNYLYAILKDDEMSSLINEKGEMLRHVVTVMNVVFEYSLKSDNITNHNFLLKFIKVFIFSCKSDSVIIYLFTKILSICANINNEERNINDKLKLLHFDDNVKRIIFLHMLKYLTEYNVNLSVTLSDIISDGNKKSYLLFLQDLVLNLVTSDAVLSSESLSIMIQALELDPTILEPNIQMILPDVMAQKKKTLKGDKNDLFVLYNTVLVKIIEMQYKLSRGPEFLSTIMPNLVEKLEISNADQGKYIAKEKMLLESNEDASKVTKKILHGNDILTEDFCDKFGFLGSQLVSWKNVDIFKMLIANFEKYCIENYTSEDTAPHVIILTEVFSSLLTSYFSHSKMADQNIPESVVRKFIQIFEDYGSTTMANFGNRILKMPYEKRILRSFLSMAFSFGQLKLLLVHYQPFFNSKLEVDPEREMDVGDFSVLHSYLSGKKWRKIFDLAALHQDEKVIHRMNLLILQKMEPLDLNNYSSIHSHVAKHIFDEFENFTNLVQDNEYNAQILFSNLKDDQIKMAAKNIFSHLSSESNYSHQILQMDCVNGNIELLSAILFECLMQIWKFYDKQKPMKGFPSIFEMSKMEDFEIGTFLKNLENVTEYFEKLYECHESKNYITSEKAVHILEIMDEIPMQFLKQNYQNMTIFTLFLVKLALKKYKQKTASSEALFDDLEKKCDNMNLRIFELSYKAPNIFDIFPAEVIFKDGGQNVLLQLTSSFGGKYKSSQIILKQAFEGLVTKENAKYFKNITKYLTKSCKILTEDPKLAIMDLSLQSSLVLFVCLSNLKKHTLSNELKPVISKTQNTIFETILNIFDEIKWKSFEKKDDKMDVDESISSVNASNIDINCDIGLDLEVAILNFLEFFSIVAQSYCDESADRRTEKRQKNMERNVAFFAKKALAALSNPSICLHHAKGASLLLSSVLKNYSIFKNSNFLKNESKFFTLVWNTTKSFLENGDKRCGALWLEVTNINLRNIEHICEICDVRYFNQTFTKLLLNFSKLTADNTPPKSKKTQEKSNTKVARNLWSCFLNANLKISAKNDARSTVVKQMCWDFYFWLRNTSSHNAKKLEGDVEEDEGFVEGKVTEKKGVKSLGKENVEIVTIYFEIISEIVATKKMILPRSVMDIIFLMPNVINFEAEINNSHGSEEALTVFCTILLKSTALINSLLMHRSELLQDRWPCFLLVCRKLIKALCLRSNTDKLMKNSEMEQLVAIAVNIEKLVQTMVTNCKQDLTRVAAYLVSDIIASFQKAPVCPGVKFHLQNCAYILMKLLDSHACGFLMRNMSDSGRYMFQQMYDSYNKYYKYTGTS